MEREKPADAGLHLLCKAAVININAIKDFDKTTAAAE